MLGLSGLGCGSAASGFAASPTITGGVTAQCTDCDSQPTSASLGGGSSSGGVGVSTGPSIVGGPQLPNLSGEPVQIQRVDIPPWCNRLLNNWIAYGVGAPPSLDCNNFVAFAGSNGWKPLVGTCPGSSGFSCQADPLVAAAALYCWAADCVYSLTKPGAPAGYADAQNAKYIAQARTELCGRLQLCGGPNNGLTCPSGQPLVCKTDAIFGCHPASKPTCN